MKNDTFFWFKENRIVIPGVKEEHFFVHITDTHLDAVDELSTEEEIAKVEYQEELWAKYKKIFADKSGEPYGEPQMISTREAFDKQIALAEELQPEVLLMSGDNLDNMHPAGERYLAKRMGEYNGRFIAVPGNHEDPSCAGVWEAGVHTIDFDGFRIVAVDNSRKTVTSEDLAALKAVCNEGIPVIILCHVPICTPLCKEIMKSFDEYFYIEKETADENACEFLDLCESCDAVRAIICGHTHGYREMEFAPGKPQIIGGQGHAGAVDLLTVAGE